MNGSPARPRRGEGVRRLLWLLSGCQLVIAPDTGPLHMARALGIPEEKWVYPHAGTEAWDHLYVSERDTLHVTGRKQKDATDWTSPQTPEGLEVQAKELWDQLTG